MLLLVGGIFPRGTQETPAASRPALKKYEAAVVLKLSSSESDSYFEWKTDPGELFEHWLELPRRKNKSVK